MTEEEKLVEGQKLLKRLDKNEDGMVDFDEFAGWFGRTCASIDHERYRRQSQSRWWPVPEIQLDPVQCQINLKLPFRER